MDTGRSDVGYDIARKLPVVFVCLIIVFLFFSYSLLHCYPLLQVGVRHPVKSDVNKGTWQLLLFLVLTVMLLICYVRSIVVDAGGIPDTPDWICGAGSDNLELPANVQETKGDGGRRKCKWCGKYKPDRCHHCRVCRVCVLKMDHHCPWIYNCVGFCNHKYFFLLLFYSCGATHLISWTMWETVKKSTEQDTAFWKMFVILFAETLAVFLCIVITLFFLFHTSLVLHGMTTIEYCEKTIKKENYNQSVWNLGFIGNLKAVFGPNVLLWFCPCSPPDGNGMNYVTEQSRLTIDMEAGKGLRKLHAQERRRRRSNKDTESESQLSSTEGMHSQPSNVPVIREADGDLDGSPMRGGPAPARMSVITSPQVWTPRTAGADASAHQPHTGALSRSSQDMSSSGGRGSGGLRLEQRPSPSSPAAPLPKSPSSSLKK